MPRLSVGILTHYTLLLSHQLFWSMSRVPIDPDTTQRFTLHQREDQPPPKLDAASKEAAPKSRRQIAYNTIGKFDAPTP